MFWQRFYPWRSTHTVQSSGQVRPSPGDQTAEVSLPRDHGYQQLGSHSANPLAAPVARGTGPAGARAISDAPSSSSVRQPTERAPQISQQVSGDLLCMGSVNWVYTVQRQPPIHPAGHGSNSGTNVPGMVSEGTLIYPAGAWPRKWPPRKTGTSYRCGTLSISGMSSTAPTTT